METKKMSDVLQFMDEFIIDNNFAQHCTIHIANINEQELEKFAQQESKALNLNVTETKAFKWLTHEDGVTTFFLRGELKDIKIEEVQNVNQ